MWSQNLQGIDDHSKNLQVYGTLRTGTIHHGIQDLPFLATPKGYNILYAPEAHIMYLPVVS